MGRRLMQGDTVYCLMLGNSHTAGRLQQLGHAHARAALCLQALNASAAHLTDGVVGHHGEGPAAGRQLAGSASHSQDVAQLGAVPEGKRHHCARCRRGLDVVPAAWGCSMHGQCQAGAWAATFHMPYFWLSFLPTNSEPLNRPLPALARTG